MRDDGSLPARIQARLSRLYGIGDAPPVDDFIDASDHEDREVLVIVDRGAEGDDNFDLREMGMLYYVAVSSQTLGEALCRVERYVRVGNEALVVRFQSSPVHQCPVVQMQDKNRRFGSNFVDFFQRWHSAFGKLKFRPTANHTNPLRIWRAIHLFF